MVHIIYNNGLDVYITTKVLDFGHNLRDKDHVQMNNNVRYLL